MTSNLEIWDRFSDIDPKFTKPITGKAYRGTSPNPQYVIKCLTEMFGPVGQGFGWEVVQEDFTHFGDEVLHWCRIRFWHTSRDNWFEAYGQTKALMKTKNGLMLDEDCAKKSLTDAIVKASSHIGVAANIFLGRWDDQKYVASVDQEFRKEEQADKIKVSAAEMKRGLEAIENDLLDCRTIPDVNACAKMWAATMDAQSWTKDYRDIAVPKFKARRDKLNENADPEDIFE